jgi:hypothetical protein
MNDRPSLSVATFKVFTLYILMAVFSGSALASTITAFGGASGPGLASVSFNSVTTPAAGNDDVVGASTNVISINQKSFGLDLYIDMVFLVTDVGVSTTEYLLNESVFNGSGVDWIGYQVRLGYGTGASFVPVTLGDGLDFDAPDFNSAISFPPFSLGAFDHGVINAVSATVSAGQSVNFSFAIDVPNTITEFTVRQEPRSAPVSNDGSSWGRVRSLYR